MDDAIRMTNFWSVRCDRCAVGVLLVVMERKANTRAWSETFILEQFTVLLGITTIKGRVQVFLSYAEYYPTLFVPSLSYDVACDERKATATNPNPSGALLSLCLPAHISISSCCRYSCWSPSSKVVRYFVVPDFTTKLHTKGRNELK
jgi:hypothetical protein